MLKQSLHDEKCKGIREIGGLAPRFCGNTSSELRLIRVYLYEDVLVYILVIVLD
jgi:hypothetical protein